MCSHARPRFDVLGDALANRGFGDRGFDDDVLGIAPRLFPNQMRCGSGTPSTRLADRNLSNPKDMRIGRLCTQR